MTIKIDQIAQLLSGVFSRPSHQADTLYLQGVHFDEFGRLRQNIKPLVKLDYKMERHLLQEGDILFAAKGLYNYGVVYEKSMGNAVASSSFIVIRVDAEMRPKISSHYLAWYLTYHPEVKSIRKQLGTTVPSISIAKLKDLEVQIPPIAQQERIAHIQKLRNKEKQLVRDLEDNKDQLVKHQILIAINS